MEPNLDGTTLWSAPLPLELIQAGHQEGGPHHVTTVASIIREYNMETENGTTASMWSREGLTDNTASRLGLKQDVICRGWGWGREHRVR